MKLLKEWWRLFRRWRSDLALYRITDAKDWTSEQRVEAYKKLVKKYGGRVVVGGPCSWGRERGETWVSYSWERPDSLCSASELNARAAMKRMFASFPTSRIAPELFEKKIIEYKPYDTPKTDIIGDNKN